MQRNAKTDPSALPPRVTALRRSRGYVSGIKALAVVLIIVAVTVGAMSILDGNRALTADESRRQAFRLALAGGGAILCAVLYATCAQINAWIDVELGRLLRSHKDKARRARADARDKAVIQAAAEAVTLGLEAYQDSRRAGDPPADA